jgi:hypothetical protein
VGRLILKRGKPSSGDLRVVLLGIRADTDRPDYVTIHDDRQRTLHFDEDTGSDGGGATTVDRILESLARKRKPPGTRIRSLKFANSGKTASMPSRIRS